MGCHKTREAAAAQIYAINRSEGNIGKRYSVKEGVPGCDGYAVIDEEGEIESCHSTREEAEAAARIENQDEMDDDMDDSMVAKAMAKEGDFVMAMTTEGMVIGQVEHVMREGGTYGEPGNPYAVQSTPENPAVAIRILEEDDDMYYYTPYSIGAVMSDVRLIDRPNISMETEDKGIGIKDPEEWPATKRDGGKFPSSMGQPYAASNGESVVKEPKKKPKRSRGGVGGDPTGAITAGPGGMSTKADEDKTDSELFAGFGKDFTRVDRRTEVFLPKDK
jgi:hypothetical protein